MSYTPEQIASYKDVLVKLEKIVHELQIIGTPEAIESINLETLESIERLKTIINESEQE